MLNESLILVFENWRLNEFLKTNHSIKLRNYGRLRSKVVFSVSIYPNNTTDLATAFFISETNSLSKYILNSTYNVCYYYNSDFISLKKHYLYASKQFDDATLLIGDATVLLDEATVLLDDQGALLDDVIVLLDDWGVFLDDATVLIDDQGVLLDDATVLLDDQGVLIDHRGAFLDDQGVLIDDRGVLLDRLVCFTSITN